MAHEIWSERFAEREGKGAAWHGLGLSFGEDEKITASEALTLAGGDFTMDKVPAFVTLPSGEELSTGEYYIYRNEHTYNGITDPGAIVGGPVSKDYGIIQNSDIAAAVDNLAKEWPVETVGSLRDGQKLFITLHGEKFAIKGDDAHELYFCISDSKSGKESLKIFLTGVRIVCSNTLRLGDMSSELKIKIGHDPNALRQVGFWTDTIPAMKAAQQRTREALELLADTKATKREVELIFNKAFPLPKTPAKMKMVNDNALSLSADHKELVDRDIAQFDYFRGRTEAIQALAWERYDIHNQEHTATAGTLFAAAQASNEVSCWRKGHSETLDSQIFDGARGDESDRAFTTAYNIATKGYAKSL